MSAVRADTRLAGATGGDQDGSLRCRAARTRGERGERGRCVSGRAAVPVSESPAMLVWLCGRVMTEARADCRMGLRPSLTDASDTGFRA